MRVVRQVLGKEIHLGGEEHLGWLPQNASQPLPTPIEPALLDLRILENVQGFILEFEFRSSSGANDSWHSTIQEAEDEAKLMFGVESSEWKSYSEADI